MNNVEFLRRIATNLEIHRTLQASPLIRIMHHVSSQSVSTRILTSSAAPSSVVNNCRKSDKENLFVSLSASGQFIIMFRVYVMSQFLLRVSERIDKNSARIFTTICAHYSCMMIFIIHRKMPSLIVRNVFNIQ